MVSSARNATPHLFQATLVGDKHHPWTTDRRAFKEALVVQREPRRSTGCSPVAHRERQNDPWVGVEDDVLGQRGGCLRALRNSIPFTSMQQKLFLEAFLVHVPNHSTHGVNFDRRRVDQLALTGGDLHRETRQMVCTRHSRFTRLRSTRCGLDLVHCRDFRPRPRPIVRRALYPGHLPVSEQKSGTLPKREPRDVPDSASVILHPGNKLSSILSKKNSRSPWFSLPSLGGTKLPLLLSVLSKQRRQIVADLAPHRGARLVSYGDLDMIPAPPPIET